MQLEQQETFTIHGPQLEVLGQVESKLPPPARKRPVAALALAVLALASVLGVGGGRLRALHDSTARIYSAAQDEYGHGIQSDLADQADAAASLIRVAGGVLGEQDADVQAARQALDAWNETADPDRPAVQYERNNTLAGAVEVLYTAASDGADARAKGQLQDLHDAFTSAQATIERAAADTTAKWKATMRRSRPSRPTCWRGCGARGRWKPSPRRAEPCNKTG